MAREKRPDDPRRFLDPAVLSRVGRLDLRARQVVEGYLTGLHASPFFGHSVEFVQHREYTPGDDIRHLDWKVWSKSDRFYIKQYEAETNLRSTLLVDCSASMSYGDAKWNKREYACTAAACLAHLLIGQQDSVGMMAHDADMRQVVPAQSSARHLEVILGALESSRPGNATNILGLLRRAAENIPQRGLVVLFSDLLVDRPALFQGLKMLRQRKHDVLVFHVLDAEEIDFNFRGTTRFEGMEAPDQLLCDPQALRDAYKEVVNEYLTEVRRGCTKIGADYLLCRTDDPLDTILNKYLTFRSDPRAARARSGSGQG